MHTKIYEKMHVFLPPLQQSNSFKYKQKSKKKKKEEKIRFKMYDYYVKTPNLFLFRMKTYHSNQKDAY